MMAMAASQPDATAPTTGVPFNKYPFPLKYANILVGACFTHVLHGRRYSEPSNSILA
jgi:hypothetical protein